MKSLCAWLLGLSLALAACQKNEQSAVQPEKLADSPSSSASAVAAAEGVPSGAPVLGTAPVVVGQGTAAPGPLLPFAKGKGPQDVKAPAKKETAGKKVTSKRPAGPTVTTEVRLVKPGDEPHRKLRLKAKVGQVDRMKMTMTMGLEMTMGGKPAAPKQDMPPMVMNMELKVSETKPNGDIRYDFVLTGTDVLSGQKVPAKVVKAMKAALSKIKGMKGYAVVSDRGFNKESRIAMPPGADPQTKQVMMGMQQAMQQLGVPLPEEPVGQGAQWKFISKLSQQGISVTQTATYDLVKLEGQALSCKIKIDQSAPRQRISAMGVSVDLLSLKSNGGGTTDQRLNKVAPVRSNIQLLSRVEMGMPENQVMDMKTSMVVDISAH